MSPSGAHEHSGVCHHHPLARHGPGDADAICVERVTYSYDGGRARRRREEAAPGPDSPGRSVRSASSADRPVLEEVTLHVQRGCNLGIVGPNGAGKTTLLKIVLGLIEGYTGSVRVMGLPPGEACRRGDLMGYVPQRSEALWRFPVSVRQVVRMGLSGKTGLFRRHARADLDHCEELLRQVGVIELADRPIGALSGGQQQRVLIARALAARPSVLLLDEPSAGLDETAQKRLAELLHRLHESMGLTVVLVSHDLRAVASSCNRIACLNHRIHYHDTPGKLTREVLAEVFEHDLAGVL